MATDSRLTDAEQDLRWTVDRRVAAAAATRRRAAERPGSGAGDGKVTGVWAQQPSSVAGPGFVPARRRPVLGPWAETAILAVLGGGQAALAYVAAQDLGLGAVPLGLLTLAVAVCCIAAARLGSRAIERVGAAADGGEDPHRRRWLDVAVGTGALACGVALAVGVGRLAASATAGPVVPAGATTGAPACAGCAGLLGSHVIVLGLALLGVATAVAYAAMPDPASSTNSRRWRSVADRLRGLQADHRSRRRLRAALAHEAAAQAAARQLRQELAVLVPQLFAAEQAALLFWRYQVAIGDATQHRLQQHLAGFTLRRSKGVGQPVKEWWRGAEPVTPKPEQFTSIGAAQEDWGEQVARVTLAAKRVLVRRGLLDITHSLRLSRPPATPPADPSGTPARPAGANQDAVARHADDQASGAAPLAGQPDPPA
jgi:hypothetical protein